MRKRRGGFETESHATQAFQVLRGLHGRQVEEDDVSQSSPLLDRHLLLRQHRPVPLPRQLLQTKDRRCKGALFGYKFINTVKTVFSIRGRP